MVLAAALSAAGMVSAQEVESRPKQEAHGAEARKSLTNEERATREAERMAKKLTLSEEQQQKWRLAVLERNQANAPIHEKFRGSTTPEERQDLRKQMKVHQKAFETKVNSFLTAEQKKKLAEEREKKREHHQKKGNRPNREKSN